MSDSAIAELLEGRATPAEAQALEAHLASCSECRQLVSRMSSVLLPAEGEPEAAPAAPAGRAPVARLFATAGLVALLAGVGGGLWLRARLPSVVAVGSELERARLALALGRAAEAQRAAAQSAAAATRLHSRAFLAESRRVESAAWLTLGEVRAARRAASDAVAQAAAPAAIAPAAGTAAVEAAKGTATIAPAAGAAAVEAADAAREADALLQLGVAQVAAGADAASDPAAAERSFERALALARTAGLTDRAARSLADLAALAARTARAADAARYLSALAQLADEAGQPAAAAAARRDLASLQ